MRLNKLIKSIRSKASTCVLATGLTLGSMYGCVYEEDKIYVNNQTSQNSFECNDGIDNDGDDLIDYKDLDCYDGVFYNPENNESKEFEEGLQVDEYTVALYKFNELSGDTAYDSSGNNNDGIIEGADWSMEGKFDGALKFDGDNGVKIPKPFYGIQNEWTIEMSFKTDRENINGNLYKHRAISRDLMLLLDNEDSFGNPDSHIYFELYTQSGFSSIKKSTDYADNEWHDIALSCDGSIIKLFFDNVEVGDDIFLEDMDWNDGFLFEYIGDTRPLDDFSNGFYGRIDEVRISDISRDPSE